MGILELEGRREEVFEAPSQELSEELLNLLKIKC